MNGEQSIRIAVAFARAVATPASGLCTACVEVLDVSGAGITVMSGGQAGPLCVFERAHGEPGGSAVHHG